MALPNIWNSYIESAATQYGVPPALVSSVIGAESSWRPGVTSPKGAGGMMQLMPDTFAELREKHGLGPDRFDPQTNIQAGTAYLGQLYKQFGNWPDAIAAYNAGPGRWAQVKAGKEDAPRETTDYVAKVTAGFQGQGGAPAPAPPPAARDVGRNMYAGQGAGMNFGDVLNRYAGTMRPGAALTEEQLLEQARGGSLSPDQASYRSGGPDPRAGRQRPGLLDVDQTNNWLDGLGGLLGEGQTGSQPPGPAISPLQYQLAGAGNAVGQLAGITNRRVGIGELLGALGGGLTQGAAAGQQAQRQQQADVREEQESRLNNVYKAAMTRKALMPERRDVKTITLADGIYALNDDGTRGPKIGDAPGANEPKVVNGGIYENGQWKRAPWATVDQGGPLEGTGIDAQMTNAYVTLSQKRASGQPLTPQEDQMLQLSERHLMKPRLVTGPDGVVREVAPPPLPGAAPPTGSAPPAATPPPGADLLDTQKPPGAAPPPAPVATVTPSGSQVTQIVPPTVKPTNEQTLASGFANRLYTANTELDTLGDRGADVPSLYDRTVGQVPLLGNYAVSSDYQQMTQAQREFINAQLRRESGAAVSESEWENARQQYFPQPGDDDAVLAQKRRSRNMAIANMAQAAGPAGVNFTPPKVTMPEERSGADNPEAARRRAKYGLE